MATIAPGRTLETTIRAASRPTGTTSSPNPEEHLLTYELTQYALRTPGFDAWRAASTAATSAPSGLPRPAQQSSSTSTPHGPVLARYVASLLDGLTLNYLVLGDTAVPKPCSTPRPTTSSPKSPAALGAVHHASVVGAGTSGPSR